jgi:hypothetical protein
VGSTGTSVGGTSVGGVAMGCEITGSSVAMGCETCGAQAASTMLNSTIPATIKYNLLCFIFLFSFRILNKLFQLINDYV